MRPKKKHENKIDLREPEFGKGHRPALLYANSTKNKALQNKALHNRTGRSLWRNPVMKMVRQRQKLQSECKAAGPLTSPPAPSPAMGSSLPSSTHLEKKFQNEIRQKEKLAFARLRAELAKRALAKGPPPQDIASGLGLGPNFGQNLYPSVAGLLVPLLSAKAATSSAAAVKKASREKSFPRKGQVLRLPSQKDTPYPFHGLQRSAYWRSVQAYEDLAYADDDTLPGRTEGDDVGPLHSSARLHGMHRRPTRDGESTLSMDGCSQTNEASVMGTFTDFFDTCVDFFNDDDDDDGKVPIIATTMSTDVFDDDDTNDDNNDDDGDKISISAMRIFTNFFSKDDTVDNEKAAT